MLNLKAFQGGDIPAEDEALRAPVREFLERELASVPAATRSRSWMGSDPDFSRKLAQHGWVGITLPTAYGGGGRSAFARFVLVEEFLRAGAPVGAHWIADRQSGPLILKYGSEAQKLKYLPPICRGESYFCIGMSEPGAGSDLASVKSRATRTATGWRLSGQKIWTTNAGMCQHMIALVRTSGSPEDRNKGLSQLIVDLSLPGITIRPIRDLTGDSHFYEVFFDEVDLAEEALIGAEGHGWEQVTSELAFERSGPERLMSSVVLTDSWFQFLRGRPAQDERAEALAGRLICELAPLRTMSLGITRRLVEGGSPVTEAALVKDSGTGIEQETPVLIADHLGSIGHAALPADLLASLAYTLFISPSFSLRGGTREILRGMIARGLGLR